MRSYFVHIHIDGKKHIRIHTHIHNLCTQLHASRYTHKHTHTHTHTHTLHPPPNHQVKLCEGNFWMMTSTLEIERNRKEPTELQCSVVQQVSCLGLVPCLEVLVHNLNVSGCYLGSSCHDYFCARKSCHSTLQAFHYRKENQYLTSWWGLIPVFGTRVCSMQIWQKQKMDPGSCRDAIEDLVVFNLLRRGGALPRTISWDRSDAASEAFCCLEINPGIR